MPKMVKQSQATNHIRELLIERGFNILPRHIRLEDNQQWIVFERGDRQIGIDSASGLWVRENHRMDWRCVCLPYMVSGALQAIEFLTNELAEK